MTAELRLMNFLSQAIGLFQNRFNNTGEHLIQMAEQASIEGIRSFPKQEIA